MTKTLYFQGLELPPDSIKFECSLLELVNKPHLLVLLPLRFGLGLVLFVLQGGSKLTLTAIHQSGGRVPGAKNSERRVQAVGFQRYGRSASSCPPPSNVHVYKILCKF